MKTKKELIVIHKELHTSLDKLIACYIENTEKLPSRTTVMELMKWSHEQTLNPICFREKDV